jgi:hypothetical protein
VHLCLSSWPVFQMWPNFPRPVIDRRPLTSTIRRAKGQPERRFKSLMWTTRQNLEPPASVVAKAEWTDGEANPRFIVTSMRRDECKTKSLDEKLYGTRENPFKRTANPRRCEKSGLAGGF